MLMLREAVAGQRDLDLGDSPFKVRTLYDTSGRPGTQMRMYYASGAALVVGQVMKMKFVQAASGNPQVITPVSGTTAIDRMVVAMNATVSGTWDWFYLEGFCSALVTSGGPVAAADSLQLKVGTSATAFSQDQSGGAMTTNTVAYADAAGPASGAAVLTRVFLLGERTVTAQ